MGVRFYSVHAQPWHPANAVHGADRAVLVKEGFSWPAFLITLPWLIWHRMWIVLVFYLATRSVSPPCRNSDRFQTRSSRSAR